MKKIGQFELTPYSKAVMDKMFAKFQEKNQMVLEHLQRCILLGTKPPRIYMRWDEKASDLIVEIRK